MRILLTGGLGFLGTNFVRSLQDPARKAHSVYILDSTDQANPVVAASAIPVYRISLFEARQVADVLERVRPDAVVHLAAFHFVPWCNAHPKETAALNTHATLRLHAMAAEYGVHQFVFASTAAVYGEQSAPCTETSETHPRCVYGTSKLRAEAAMRQTDRPAHTILRFFNLYGPHDSEQFLIPTIRRQLSAHPTELFLGGNLQNRRDYLHASDAVASIWAVLGNPAAFGATFNVGTGVAVSGMELVRICAKITGSPINVKQNDSATRQKDLPFLCADASKLRRAVGWQPTVSLEMGLRSLWRLPTATQEAPAQGDGC